MRMFIALPTVLLLAACATPAAEPVDPADLAVVTTTTVLGDLVDQITACGGGTSTTVMPVGADPHDFSPSAEQVAQLVRADVVIMNGLDYESGLTSALENAEADGARLFAVGPELDPIEFANAHEGDELASDDDHGHDDDHGYGSEDPHVWLDMGRMAQAAQIIGVELDGITGQDGTYAACGDQVAKQISEAEVQVKEILASVPEASRVLVTDHESLGYFAEAYGFEIAGTVIPASTTLAQPSSADLAALTQLMKDEGVSVIFVNSAEPTRLAEAVAAETGTQVRVEALFVESLGEPGSGAETYTGMMLTNAQRIATNLRG